jgi:DNA polymerase III delta prime subunit
MKKPWVEKYRPKTLNDVIMPARTAKILQDCVRDGQFENILLYGGPGTGKTSISLALMRDLNVEKADILKINCSDEKIEAVRDKIKGFATTMPMGKFKVVRLEEFDYMGHEAQALLRVLMEDVIGSCRFIATCNYVNKVIPSLRSRFTHELPMLAPTREEVLVRAAEILEQEGVSFSLDDLEKVVAVAYPDVRKVIQLLQSSTIDSKLDLDSGEKVVDWKLDLLPTLEASDLKTARKIVCESATPEEMQDVYRFLFDNIHRVKKLKGYIDEAIVLIAEYQYKHAFVADKEINVAALFIEIDSLTR